MNKKWTDPSAEELYLARVSALQEAKANAQNPEFKNLWEQKLGELVRNENVRLMKR